MASHLLGSLNTCFEGCVGPGLSLSLAWAAWLRLLCNALPMKEVGELTVCSSYSSENYWNMVEPRLQPCVAGDISPPRPISVSGAAFPCQLLAYFIAAR
jgi:hypothetical protein